jgi:drug/metabolite transporter (DMT)-like permease
MTAATLLLTACALLAFAGNSLLCRAAIGGGAIDPANFTLIRLVSGALALFLLGGARMPALPRGRGTFVTALPLALYAIAFAFAYIQLSAGTGALILFGAVQLTMLTSAWRAGERPRFAEWLGIGLALGGLLWLVAPGVTAPPPGSAALMALAGVAWGVYSLHGRGATNALAETQANFLRAAPFALLSQAFVWPHGHWTWPGIGLAIASGALASGVGYALWFRALPRLTATRAAAVQLAVPALAALGGVLFLGERLSARLVCAAALILGGIGLTLARRRRGGAPAQATEAAR